LTIHIANDYGGNVAAYAVYERWIEKRGEHVVISGPCASACTVLLALPGPQLCATTKAELHFHQGTTVLATETMWASYPERIRDWLAQRGGLTAQWLYLRGLALFTMIRRCHADE